jgi:ABC-type sugar transport system substrate-binding protein
MEVINSSYMVVDNAGEGYKNHRNHKKEINAMKKILALVLVLTMTLALVACGGSAGSKQPQNTGAPSPSASQTPAQQPAENPSGSENPGSGTIGYVTDEIDHWARDPYHIVYYNYRPSNVTFQITDALEELGKVYNFTIEQLSANGDADAYVNNLHTILLKEPDGLIIDITQELSARVSEICTEYEVPAICVFNKAEDVNGSLLIPSVIMDQKYNGRTQMDFLVSVYKDYWGDIDPSKIALLIMDWSQNMDINTRAIGAKERWDELFPNNRYFYGDTAADKLSAEAGFNVANSILSANPDVEYWFIVATVEDVALGTGRAVEALGLTDRVLMTSSGAAILPGEWDAGYDGIWIANYAVPPFMYAGIATFGLFALIDGRATTETLWPEFLQEGDRAARYMANAQMMTLDNYKDYLGEIARSFGVEVS